ncbi:MAG TPA: cobalamin-dependent protein [Geobacteraceae bacterium]
MKVVIVSPEFPFSGRVPLVPPILEYLAALTERVDSSIEYELVDANQQAVSPETISADLVAVSVMTATAPWAYRFADRCRELGLRVVLGGIHPTALPEEASLHADSVVVGEAESVWGEVLADARRGSLRPFYHGERLPLEGLPQPIDGRLKGDYHFRAFFTMRGCPYRCTFCSVRRFFGDTIRYRPIPEVAAEIEARAGKVWFNGDDNIWGGDALRSILLFEELARGSKKHWYGFGDLKAVQGPNGGKMLAAARKSGLFSVWVGWEGDEDKLGTYHAGGKQGADRVGAVRKMQDAGIDVILFVVLGGRHDSVDSFARALELSERLQVGLHPVLLTPLPGTELYESYRPFLFQQMGWDYYTGVRAVFEHPDPEMTPRRREEEYHRLNNELFRFSRIMKRISKIPFSGFPATHFLSLMMQLPMKSALRKAYDEWLREVGGGDSRSGHIACI